VVGAPLPNGGAPRRRDRRPPPRAVGPRAGRSRGRPEPAGGGEPRLHQPRARAVVVGADGAGVTRGARPWDFGYAPATPAARDGACDEAELVVATSDDDAPAIADALGGEAEVEVIL